MDSIKLTVGALQKKYGDKIIRTGNELKDIRRVPLNIPSFDYVTTGGIIINHITELYGDFSSLKSYFMYKALGEFQKYDWANDVPGVIMGVEKPTRKGGEEKLILKRGYKPIKPPMRKKVALIDVEASYVKTWGKMLGVDNEELLHCIPESLNQAVDITTALLSDPEVCFIGFDSMIATGSDAETDKSMEDEQMAVNARFWNKAARKIKGFMNKNTNGAITFMAINGFYDKVGMVFGNPEVVKNGNQFKLTKDVSVRTVTLKEHKLKVEGKEIIAGRNIVLRNKKNKFGTPYLESTLYYSFIDDGFLKKGETNVLEQLIELGIQMDLIERTGHTYKFGTEKGVGMEAFKRVLHEGGGWKTLKKEVYKRINGDA